MGGPRLTPDQIEIAAAEFARTGNLHDAARVIGASVSGLRTAFKRNRIARNRTLHMEACERGIREQRERLKRFAIIIEDTIGKAGDLEPKDLAALVNANSKASETLLAFIDAERVRKQSLLTRQKTRRETEMLEARIKGTLPPERHEVTHDARDALAERFARLAGLAGPDCPGEGDPPPSTG